VRFSFYLFWLQPAYTSAIGPTMPDRLYGILINIKLLIFIKKHVNKSLL